jgi:hypothetical protein
MIVAGGVRATFSDPPAPTLLIMTLLRVGELANS